MKVFLILLVSCVVQSLAGTANWTGLTIRYGPYSQATKNSLYFLNVPTYIGEQVDSGDWVPASVDNLYNLQALSFKVASDYAFTPFYDQGGFISGAQICEPADAIRSTQPSSYDPISLGTVEVKMIDGVDQYCTSFLIVSPETLISGGRTEMGSSIGEGLWLRDTFNKKSGYRKIPDDIDTLLEETLYKWQACVETMGTHYFYNATLESDCNKVFNWILIGKHSSNTINGLVHLLMGQKVDYSNDILEISGRAAVETIAPVVNECYYDWAETYGVVSLHIYFTNEPELIKCAVGDGVNG